jgi:hypothetical protein
VYTLIETPTFVADADKLWSEEERLEFFSWLALNPNAGAVVARIGGCRKVRWSIKGHGKSGGVRVIYFNRLASGQIWLLLIYAKSAIDSIPGRILKSIREEIEDG